MKYVLVFWPEIQNFMEHERWNECLLCIGSEENPCPVETYAVPEDLFNEVYKELKSIK